MTAVRHDTGVRHPVMFTVVRTDPATGARALCRSYPTRREADRHAVRLRVNATVVGAPLPQLEVRAVISPLASGGR
jgi:hypothetical protein